MKQYQLSLIALLAAAILALSTLDFGQGNPAGRSYKTYGHYSCPSSDIRGCEVPLGFTDGPIAEPHELLPGDTAADGMEIPFRLMASPSASPEPPAILAASAMMELSPVQLPPLDAGMVNVTGGFDGDGQAVGYRVNPQPGEFAISIPYDPALLPQGFTEEDIQTYVYDRTYNRWVAIQRDSVNGAEWMICSRYRPWDKGMPDMQDGMVGPQDALALAQGMMSMNGPGEGGDSPLDFINAVLKTPEMPETSSYTPTSIKELKAADPLEGLTLMQPPTANNSGTANLSYPIEIPAGRQGMQPNLALTYSSGGGNGWLGVGWDISIPSISVETRWGVPRYNTNWESEVYVYEGEQLVTKDANGNYRPMAHRTNDTLSISRLNGNVRFYPRRDEAFDSIVRHGSGPGNYWWSVTHRNGVTDYYGKQHGTASVNYGSVLCDSNNHCISQWMLTGSMDADGNWVRYYYSKERRGSINNGHLNCGVAVYCDSIVYTGHDNLDAEYVIRFNRGDRMDVSTNARNGFREVLASKLCRIDILFSNDIVRRYFFLTENNRNSNFKTRLTDLVRTDSDQDINQLAFTECDSILSSLTSGKTFFQRTHFDYFDYPKVDSLYGNPVTNNLPNDGIKSSFRRDNVPATALGATTGCSFNAGGTFSIGVQNNNYVITDFNVGGNFSYGRSESEGALTLIDINGDGLADKVFKKGYNLYYRPMQVDSIDCHIFTYGAPVSISGANSFLNEVSYSPSLGLQGSIPIMAVSAGAPSTFSSTSTYFADVNGDGLPDIVTENGVLFNTLDSTGHPHFISANVLRTDSNTGNVNTNQVIMTSTTTPCGGIIFDGEVDPDILCSRIYTLDSCNAKLEPRQFDDLMHSSNISVVGFSDSILYYYVNTVEPVVECGSSFSEPDLDAVKVWVAPYTGTIKVRSEIAMLPDSSESFLQSRKANGIGYAAEWNAGCSIDNSFVLNANDTTTLFKGSLCPTDTSVTIDSIEIAINQNDILFFRLMSKSDRSFDRVDWRQTITYTSISDIRATRQIHRYNSSEDFILTGRSFFQAPKDGQVILSGNYSGNPGSSSATLNVYRNTVSTLSRSIPANVIGNISIDTVFSVIGGDSIIFKISGNGNSNVNWNALECRPYLRFVEDPTDMSISIPDTMRCYPPVRMAIQHTDTSSLFNGLRKFFGPLYRGWGQFAYNNNQPGSDTLPIDVSTLILPSAYWDSSNQLDSTTLCDAFSTSQFSIDTINNTTDISENTLSASIDNIFNPLTENSRWVEMIPDNERMVWMGFGQTTSVGRSMMSNTRPTILIPVLNEEDTFPSSMVGRYEIPTYDSPIPNNVTGGPVQTLRKQNTSVLKDASLSLIISDYEDQSNSASLSMGTSISEGENYIESDYLDLNGDRYPDMLCRNNVQYTMPWGGIGNVQCINMTDNIISQSETSSSGGTFSASYPMPKRLPSSNPQKAKISLESLGGSSVDGDDKSCIMYLDVNGDGLPDRFDEKMSVSINNGYGFDSFEDWNVLVPRRGTSHSSGSSSGVGFSLEQSSISGGVGHNSSDNETVFLLMDFNGDGLPDKVQQTYSGLSVSYNLGNGQWSSNETISALSHIGLSHSYSESDNGSLTLGFPIAEIVKIQAGIQMSPYNCSFSFDDVQLTDIDGDGYPDYVSSDRESSMTIRYNRAGKTNLLRKVTNFTGSSIELDYEMPTSCYEKPQRSWNLAVVKVCNNDTTCPVGGNRTLSRFEYSNPNYNRYERMDFGYSKITSFQYDTQGGDSLYRYTVEEFNNANFTKRGRKTRDCLYDAHGKAYVEHLYDAIVLDYAGSEVSDDSCARADIYIGVESDLTNYYEGLTPAQITTRIVKRYDNHRNVTEFIYYGDTTHHERWFKADISYRPSPGYNLISLSDTIIVTDFSGDTLQKRTATYYPNGKLNTLKRYNDTITSCFDFTYDLFGALTRAKLPANMTGQRLEFNYDYDPVVHTYPSRVENLSLGYVSTASYDYRFGKPTMTTDINGNIMQYEYDVLGRTTKIIAPYETNNADPYTIIMEYHPHKYGQLDIFQNDNNPYSYAITEHYDCQHPGNPIRTTLITDGLGRLLQTKKDAEIGGQEVSLVTGKVVYDCFGRTLKQFHPFTKPLGAEEVYNDSVTAGTETVTKYDLMDRQIRVTVPGNYTTCFNYGFGTHNGNRYFSTTTTDALNNSVTVLKGSLGEQIRVDAPMSASTTFSYDAIGQLLTSIDPDGMVTSYTYDQFGQLTKRIHPDAGRDTYCYDPSGNMVLHVNGNGDSTLYMYNYNQLIDILYPSSPANDVHYKYGAPGAAYNRAGRIMYQEDASGWQIFSYGKLGEVTENIRTFALPYEENPYTFKMKFAYDSWNRIQNMTYPDGEVVYYDYNKGGMLDSIYGHKNGFNYPYVNHINYNQFEQKDSVLYGNGTVVTYQYDTLMRLKHLRSYTGTVPAEQMQNITYQYDSVSNIVQIKNQALMLSNGLGGTYVSNYTYDHLYRLSAANGNWDNGTLYNTFSVNMGYNLNGRIYKKNIQADILDYHGNVITKRYQNTYSYNSTRNTPQMVDDAISGQRQYFSWDHNGNMITQMDREDCSRLLCWSEENRLMGVADCNYASLYQYDANGERTYKLTGQYQLQYINGHQTQYASMDNATLYASPYLVCTPKGYTKHYYAESERVASKIGNGCLQDLCSSINTICDFNKKEVQDNKYLLDCDEESGAFKKKKKDIKEYYTHLLQCLNAENVHAHMSMATLLELQDCTYHQEKDCYWYHPDHLGSSSWITETNGSAVQHLHYLPWGEEFVDQRSTSWSARFAFSAKERDAETGLSYFGSRYYSSDLSIWLAVDPMSDKYPSMSPYVYCADNPVKLVDPNGEENLPALMWARANMSNKGIPSTYNNPYFGGSDNRWTYKKGTIPSRTVCYESCFMAYMNSTEKVVSHLKQTGFASPAGGFLGRSSKYGGMNWFKNGDGTDRSFVTDITKGELGDIVFMGESGEMQGHAVLLNGLPEFATDEDGNVDYNTIILNTLSTSSDSDPDNYGERVFTFEKQKDGSWRQKDGAEYIFRGYGQLNADFSKEE
ncbi:MAG: hypothetical protein MJZ57_06430 [Bacteroidales bacterium]|nr:hypothetical protein [Bacteroidales bacterium]